MKLTTPLFGLAAVLGFASGHMEMTSPAPLRSKSNPNTNNVDYDMVNPLSADGSNFPCKGYLNLLGTPAGKAVADWNAGSPLSFTIAGGAHHNGGSCQASISLDSGRTFKVIKSFLGGCPTPGTSNWDFVLPADVPTTDNAIFAWTWFNRVGNREMYMNCAVVNIKGGGGGSPSVPFSQRPAMFVANVNNGCGTLEGSDVRFPNPGPDVSTIGNNFAAPVGNCGSTVSYPEQPEQPEQPNPQLPTTTALAVPTPTTLPGGIFIPVTTLTTTTAAPPAQPTTTRPADPPVNPPVNPPVTPPVTPPVIGVEDIGPQVEWSRCTQEGVFNCVGGTRFQRCGSGLWSPFLQTAPGTRCKPGVSNEYTVIVVRKRRTVRYRRADKI